MQFYAIQFFEPARREKIRFITSLTFLSCQFIIPRACLLAACAHTCMDKKEGLILPSNTSNYFKRGSTNKFNRNLFCYSI